MNCVDAFLKVIKISAFVIFGLKNLFKNDIIFKNYPKTGVKFFERKFNDYSPFG